MSRDEPGQFPFTRGIYPEMYKQRLWTMRQYAGFTTAEESNKRYRYLLDHGVSGLSVAFDLPTQIGYDSDHEMALDEVGKVGVPISTPDDMIRLFKDIPLESVSTSMTINATAAILLALYIVTAEKQGVSADKLNGTIQNDILKEYIARGTYIYPPGPSLRIVTDIFDFCSNHVPNWNTISISGYHIREAGSTAAQELAFTLANGIAYVQAAIDKGLDVDTFGKRISFFFNSHNDFLTEVAKFRAARRMWAKIMKEHFVAIKENTMMGRFHTQNGGSTLTAQQIDNNVVRTTIQAMSAVLGGTQSLHTNSRDEALALPTDTAAKLALRTQQIIAHESGIVNHPDPLGGSYLIEELTDQLEVEANAIIADIEAMGGAVEAIDKGWIQNEISRSAYEYQINIDTNEQIIVGVNKYESDEEDETELLSINQKSVEVQKKRVVDFKIKRNNDHVQNRLSDLQSAAANEENLMPAIIECVKHDCTLGEIADILRAVFGEYNSSF